MKELFHLAGEPIGLKQSCERCGQVLCDYEGAQIMGTKGVDDRPMYFPALRMVHQVGNALKTVDPTIEKARIESNLCPLKAPAAAVEQRRALCLHRNFETDVKIAVVKDRGAWIAEVRIVCSDCAEPFRFVGVPAGFAYGHPRVSIDGRELRAPIEPLGSKPAIALASAYDGPKGTLQ